MPTTVLERPALEAPFYLTLSAEAVEETDDGKRIVEGFAATSDLDLQGDIIRPEALDKAAAGAIGLTVLLNHDQNLIIGKVVDARAIRDGGEGKLWVKVEIDSGEDKVWGKIQQGMLNKFSIRGKVNKAHRRFDRAQNQQVNIVEELQLLEVSLVAVPANPKALAVRSYIAKGLAEFVKSGGVIPADDAREETIMTLHEEWTAYCAEKGFDPLVAEVGEGQDEAEVLKAAGDQAVQLWDEFCKAKEKPYPYPYPYPKPRKKEGAGDAGKMIDDAMAALKMDKPDVAAALKALAKAKTALAKYPAPAKKEEKDKEEPVADAGKKAVELLDDMISKATDEMKDALTKVRELVEQIAAGAKADDAAAKGAGETPLETPAQPVTAEAVKEALDALRKDYEDLATEMKARKLASEVVKEADGLTYTQEEVDAICRKLLWRSGVLKEKE